MPAMELLLLLLVLLIATRLLGEAAERLGQPSLVGELLAGVLLGFLAAMFAGDLGLANGGRLEVPRAIVDIAIFFLMFLAGLEMRPGEILESSRASFIVALGGLLVPLGLGFLIGWYFLPDSPVKDIQSLFIGTALAITAVPVSVRMLMDLGRLHTRFGEIIVSAAIFDDVLGLILLAILTSMVGTGEPPAPESLLVLGGQVLLFLGVVSLIGAYVYPPVLRAVSRFKSGEPVLAMLLIFALSFSVLAEILGMHFIVGAFAAGLFFSKTTIGAEAYARAKEQTAGVTTAFLAPIFFASIGLRAELEAVAVVPVFTAILVVAAFLGKMIGAGLPAFASGLPVRDAASVGAGMSGRGAVELIIADIALSAGLFSLPDPPPPVVASLFSAIVAMALVTTLLTPIMLRAISAHHSTEKKPR